MIYLTIDNTNTHCNVGDGVLEYTRHFFYKCIYYLTNIKLITEVKLTVD